MFRPGVFRSSYCVGAKKSWVGVKNPLSNAKDQCVVAKWPRYTLWRLWPFFFQSVKAFHQLSVGEDFPDPSTTGAKPRLLFVHIVHMVRSCYVNPFGKWEQSIYFAKRGLTQRSKPSSLGRAWGRPSRSGALSAISSWVFFRILISEGDSVDAGHEICAGTSVISACAGAHINCALTCPPSLKGVTDDRGQMQLQGRRSFLSCLMLSRTWI